MSPSSFKKLFPPQRSSASTSPPLCSPKPRPAELNKPSKVTPSSCPFLKIIFPPPPLPLACATLPTALEGSTRFIECCPQTEFSLFWNSARPLLPGIFSGIFIYSTSCLGSHNRWHKKATLSATSLKAFLSSPPHQPSTKNYKPVVSNSSQPAPCPSALSVSPSLKSVSLQLWDLYLGGNIFINWRYGDWSPLKPAPNRSFIRLRLK